MRRYPPIAEHGLIGDLQTCALVSSEGALNWLCSPRFDSPSVFAALLDHDRGGHFTITVDAPGVTVRQLYLADTAVLITRFLTPDGVGELADFMPVDRPQEASRRHRVVRVLRVVRGTVRFALECRPRFDYGRERHELEADTSEARFRGRSVTAYLQTLGPVPLRRDGADVRATATLSAGQLAAAVLTLDDSRGPAPERVTEQSLRAEFAAVREFWHGWIGRSRYRGRWQQQVNRSAITLKLLTYAPTGAPIAAATAGLPEQVGGERNWDYRHTWVRDASLSVRALLDLGFSDEAHAFRRWLGDRVRQSETVSGEPLQIMYRVDGDPRLPEQRLDHFEGWRGSAPVRIGNSAAGQLQLDIYGEAVFALAQAPDLGSAGGYEAWQRFAALIDWLCDHWDRPDEGIWETRGGQRDFTYSRVMCWVAFDRAIRHATAFARPAGPPPATRCSGR
jgi:GH15 family glucan-1,4-alpha-glucosidase